MDEDLRIAAVLQLLNSQGPPSGKLKQIEFDMVKLFVPKLAEEYVITEDILKATTEQQLIEYLKLPPGVAQCLKRAFP